MAEEKICGFIREEIKELKQMQKETLEKVHENNIAISGLKIKMSFISAGIGLVVSVIVTVIGKIGV